MADLIELTRRMLHAIETSDESALGALLADDVVQVEYPNRLTPNGATRDRAAMLDGLRRGRRVLRSSRFELHHVIARENDVALECTWTATLAVPIGNKQAGDTMTARFAVFLKFRGEQIVSQRNYDCFDPF